MAFLLFDGIDITKHIKVKDVNRDSQSEIEVEAVLQTASGSSAQSVIRTLKKLLYHDDYKELIFGDEPDKFYYAKVISDFKTDRKRAHYQYVTITFEVKNGIAWQTTYNDVKDITKNTKQVDIKIDNDGTTTALPIIQVDFKGDNGFLSVVSPKQILEIGSPEAADMISYARSERLFDYRNFKSYDAYVVSAKNVAITDVIGQKQTGSISTFALNGGDWLGTLSQESFADTIDGSGLTFNIPANSEGQVGSLYEQLYWMSWFETGSANQMGVIKVSVSDANGKFLYAKIIEKTSLKNIATVKFVMATSDTTTQVMQSIDFVPSYKQSENGYLSDNGHDAMYRSDDTVTFYHAGGYYPFRSDYIKSKKSKQVHVYIGSVRGQNKVTNLFVANLMYQSDKVAKIADVPNRFGNGDTVIIDCEKKQVLVNGRVDNEIIFGSEFPKLPIGQTTTRLLFSSWNSSVPDVSVKYRKRYN